MKGEKKRKGSVFRSLRWGAWLPTLITVVIGILLVAVPESAQNVLCITAGILLAASGALFLFLAFSSGKAEIVQILVGAVEVALAVWLFVDTNGALAALIILFSVFLLLRAFVGLWGSITARRAGGEWWKIQLGGSLVVGVAAIVLIFLTVFQTVETLRVVMTLVGVFMLLDAALELVAMFRKIFIRPVKPLKEVKEAPELKEGEKKKE